MTFLADGYRNVDEAADLTKLKTCLSLMEELPDFQAYKRASYDALRLRPDSQVADIACGLGFDLPRLRQLAPQGTVTGFDLSETFVSFAKSHAECGPKNNQVTVKQGDIHNLDCEAESFDAARIDRSLQHIPDPGAALAEMARIVRPGGIICAAEPDWSSYVIGSAFQETASKITHEFARTFRNPLMGLALVDLLGEGQTLTHHSAHLILLRRFADAEIIFDITQSVQRCTNTNVISAEDAEKFLNDLKTRDQSNRFFARLTVHVVAWQR